MSDLNKKVAVITGSTSGIGEGIARMLSQAGTSVIINSVRSVKKGQALAQELGNALYVQGNIGVEADCQRVIAETIQHFGRLDILVNNAGESARVSGDPLVMSNEYFSTVLNTNVVGTWCLIREALPHLHQTGDGHVVNITSCAGIDPASASSAIAYSVAKAAINHLTKFIAKHAGPKVRANAIAPGLIMTPRTEDFDEAINKFKQGTPLQRTGVPQDIAQLVLAVIRSNYINGEVILADGGFSTT